MGQYDLFSRAGFPDTQVPGKCPEELPTGPKTALRHAQWKAGEGSERKHSARDGSQTGHFECLLRWPVARVLEQSSVL